MFVSLNLIVLSKKEILAFYKRGRYKKKHTSIIGCCIAVRISQHNMFAQCLLYSAICRASGIYFSFHWFALRAVGRTFLYGTHID